MLGQSLFIRASNLLTNSRLLLNNRVVQINQISGIKQRVSDRLKELKTPQKPKRPLTAYLRFIQDRRPDLVSEHPDWKITDIGRKCASEWKTIDPSLKEKYEQAYKTDLESYAKRVVEYSKNLTTEQKEALQEQSDEVKQAKAKRKRKKRDRELNKPKRPMGAYMMYVVDQAKVRKEPYTELLKILKDSWASMPDNEKIKYTGAALQARERYNEELLAWEEKMIKEGNLDVVRNMTLDERDVERPRVKQSSRKKSNQSLGGDEKKSAKNVTKPVDKPKTE